VSDLLEDAKRVAKYLYDNKYLGSKGITVGELRGSVSLSEDDFDLADDYLLDVGICAGTMGGDTGLRSLTATGVLFATDNGKQVVVNGNPDLHLIRLLKLYTIARGSTQKGLTLTEVLNDENLNEEEAWKEADYMEGEGWTETLADNGPPYVRLTHEGIKVAEHQLSSVSEASKQAKSVGDRATLMNNNPIDVFISHSSKDADVAAALIELIRSALNLNSGRIRCTSVPGYMFDAGTPIDEQIRMEVDDSSVFIGLITPNSINSTYVLFELGARWGARRDLSLLLASGAEASDLPAPLKKHSALRCDNAAQVQQFIEGIARKYGYELDRASAYESRVRELVRKSKGAGRRTKQKGKTGIQGEQQSTMAQAEDDTVSPNRVQGGDTSKINQPTDAGTTVSLTTEVAAWLLKDFLNGIISWLDLISTRFNQNAFPILASRIQLYSDVYIYSIDLFTREELDKLLTSHAGEYFLHAFPRINDKLTSFVKQMDELHEALRELEKAIEASPGLLRRLKDLYASKMERERIPRSEIEQYSLEEMAARWLGELRLTISNYKVESKEFLVRFTTYALLGLKVEFPIHARRDDEVILNFTHDLPQHLQDDAAARLAEEVKRLCGAIASESKTLLEQMKKERLAMSVQYKAPF
jgi:hypothetical protein